MYCPSTILVNNNWLWVHLKTDGDFYKLRHIPLKNWINPKRYEIGIGGKRNGKRPIMINRGWKYLNLL